MVGTSTSDENVVDYENQTENAQGGLSKSPETMKDNKNIQNNTEKSCVNIVGERENCLMRQAWHQKKHVWVV